MTENKKYIQHYGTKFHSGRYPYGSGDNPYQHSIDFLTREKELRKSGITEKERAEALGLSIEKYRISVQSAQHYQREQTRQTVISMKEHGYSNVEIANKLGLAGESSVRNLLREDIAARKNSARAAADILAKEIEEKGIIDVGSGVELSNSLGISRTKLKEAMFIVEAEHGYFEGGIGIQNATDPMNKTTTVMIMCKDEDIFKKARKDPSLIKSIGDEYTSDDGGETFRKVQYPASVGKDRVAILYEDEGGKDYDGLILVRPGVPDLNLGASSYCQGRILVNDTHYLKGMIKYDTKGDIPEGKDILFSTNKKSGTKLEDVLKPIKDDPHNPFGAALTAKGQSEYIGADGKKHLSAINKLKEEGEWDTEKSRVLSSQFLSKQPIALIKRQLGITYSEAEDRLNDILAIKNKAVRKHMLSNFAEALDKQAVHLKAAGLPRQKTQVILPLSPKGIKDTEVFAPNFKDGEVLYIIRYPHASTSEIAALIVNNHNKEGLKSIGPNAKDAIGINSRVAERLSGADFDGDFVIAIPGNSKTKIKTSKPFPELKGFDPKEAYETYPSTDANGNKIYVNKYGNPVKILPESMKQKQMGSVSNLITDMHLAGAPNEDIALAMKHSMCIIDACKHHLDYTRSEKENQIDRLKKEWQDGGGAKTLISKRKQDIKVPERKGAPKIDPETGELIYKYTGGIHEEKKIVYGKDPETGKRVKVRDPETGRILKKGTGVYVPNTTKSNIIRESKDLHTLSTGSIQEAAYADYGNKIKALANRTRKEFISTGNLEYSNTAKKKYSKEVGELDAALKKSKLNSPKERQAQAIANATINAQLKANLYMSQDEEKKLRQNAINAARAQVGARGKQSQIYITDKQWEAIQSGALHDSKVLQILTKADSKRLNELVFPKDINKLNQVKINRMKAMLNSGYTNQEIADALGVSTSTITKYSND